MSEISDFLSRVVFKDAVDLLGLPDLTVKLRPKSTINNVREICRRLGVVVRYNTIKKEEEILIPGHSFSRDNMANASLAWIISWCNQFNVTTGSLGSYLTFLADQNLYNPVTEWINSKPWDGINRVDAFYDTITAIGEGKNTYIKRWMISAIAAAFNPMGVSAQGVLVLQGDQYIGKTAWFKSLVPADLGVTKDGMLLCIDNKDSVKQVLSNWLVELGELDATFKKSDIAQLKAFITKDVDVMRLSYAKCESHFERRTVFFASVNDKQYLHDTTGNRRYWTIECKEINHNHSMNMQQVWAEFYEMYKCGEQWHLSADEMMSLNSHNEEYQATDPISERIFTGLSWSSDPMYWKWKTVTDVLIDLGISNPSKGDLKSAAAQIRKLNGANSKRTSSAKLLLVPDRLYHQITH